MNFRQKETFWLLFLVTINVEGTVLDEMESPAGLTGFGELRTSGASSPSNPPNDQPSPSAVARRDVNSKGHSFMYFGKRSPEERNIAELFQYLQRSQEPSWKRGHSIMRFGKRSGEKHNFIRFGKRSTGDYDDYDLGDVAYPEDVKRSGHSMMYFGKRGGHSMMYFGKRYPYAGDEVDKRGGHSMMYFGKRDGDDGKDEKRGGHSMMYFGKRGPPFDDEDDAPKRAGHSMMYFGKRDGDDERDDKRGGHSMMYFGKREDDEDQKRGGHSMMYFGKRDGVDERDDKRGGHSMMYFGKRENDEDQKRGGHSMMYFGKRESLFEDESSVLEPDDSLKSEDGKRAKHDMMYFGKRDEGSEDGKRAHSMIHFGKKSDDGPVEKKADHSIIRFGKRRGQLYSEDDGSSWMRGTGPLEPITSRYMSLLDSNPQRRQVYDKKKHNMMHFGKRSIEDESGDSSLESNSSRQHVGNGSSTVENVPKDIEKALKSRKKRELDEPFDEPIRSSPYEPRYNPGIDEAGYLYANQDYFPSDVILPGRNNRQDDAQRSKNIFLRFG